MTTAGIEKINIYGCSLRLSIGELARARGLDERSVLDSYMVGNRALNPLFEDAVTMAANAATPLLSDDIREKIGLLIFGTETASDLSRPSSTHIIEAFGLPSNIRNFEIKHACYSGAAALGCALDWVRSGEARGRKALVLASDFSRMHLGRNAEPVLGGCAAAAIISDTPAVIEYEPGRAGLWSGGVYDTFRPDARLEIFNEELSLFSYLEALHESYRDYAANSPQWFDFRDHFRYWIYHMPFPSMALRAHRSLMNTLMPGNGDTISASFRRQVGPSLTFASQVGSVYGASNFIGLCGLIHSERERIRGGERIGFFSYGSGAIGQFYSGLILPGAVEEVDGMKMAEALEERRKVSVQEYERIERLRDSNSGMADFEPSLDFPEGLFESHYRGRNRLFLRRITGHKRIYEWS